MDLSHLRPVMEKFGTGGRSQLIPALIEAQEVYGYLPEQVLQAIGSAMKIPLVEIYGVTEFYSMLYTEPVGKTIVRVCTNPPCSFLGGEKALLAAQQAFPSNGTDPSSHEFTVEESPCLGLCDHGPAALVGEVPVARLDPGKPATWIKTPQPVPATTIGGQPRWLTQRCGVITPLDLDAFREKGGFAGLQRALHKLTPIEVVEEIKQSKLVGRGGAAFPTGVKLEYTAAAPEQPRYVVCNADESEPGTFKDRTIMAGDPFSVLEGLIISGYAIGAEKGFIYIRGEYPRIQHLLNEAIRIASEAGFLGEDILGTGFNFEIELRSGAGAYICGEETALFESIEGKRGFPRLKPPYPTTHGLYGKPTAINNVETLSAMAWIMANGAQAYRAIGTGESPGTKLFCLSGDIAQPGVYEVPFGTTLRSLLDQAGGVQGELQAVLLGGAAGLFARPEEIEVPMSFEGLKAAGLSLGSGVAVAVNTERDMRQILLSLAHFFAHESCGKCFPCQLGTQRQLEIVARLAQGSASASELEALEEVAFAMSYASLCGLGMTAGIAIQSALKKWPELGVNGTG